MTSDRIPEGVGRTAIGVARARARESARPDRLFEDPYAAAFVAAAPDGPPTVPRTEVSPARVALARHLVIRTRFFDDYLTAATRAGCTQVVVPAAGLDTRAFRLDWPAGTRVFELDTPAVLGFKERVLAEQGAQAPVPRTTLAVDLREDWAGSLVEAGFDPAARTVWLVEGLLVYLGPDEAAAVLGTIDSLSAPGSRLALTHGFNSKEQRRAGTSQVVEGIEWGPDLAPVVALWRGGLDEDPVGWLNRRGWRAEWHDRAELAVGYGRPADYVTSQRILVTAER
ncbi:SAM-dependent methyltransferase [Kitasatospora sp. NPDC008050]|uniref:SAM-dependent methyltransferase n=1 Tax=Kitasatospora sp. NPDC008050 TaxID=3364021 RepID=UPI0036E7BE34